MGIFNVLIFLATSLVFAETPVPAPSLQDFNKLNQTYTEKERSEVIKKNLKPGEEPSLSEIKEINELFLESPAKARAKQKKLQSKTQKK